MNAFTGLRAAVGLTLLAWLVCRLALLRAFGRVPTGALVFRVVIVVALRRLIAMGIVLGTDEGWMPEQHRYAYNG
jgi:hypothetical protein